MPTELFILVAIVTLASAVAAMSLRNLVHCALMLMLTLGGVGAFYLQLGAQFVGLAQVLVYLGAVAIVIVFAIMLTRGSEPAGECRFSGAWWAGVAVAVAVFGLLAAAIVSSQALHGVAQPPPEATVREIGNQLMGRFVLALEVMGLLLTAALIGAVIIALHEKERE
jgi:NADH:ubiquinone oxidoreductase subunit 6 (subunit J)